MRDAALVTSRPFVGRLFLAAAILVAPFVAGLYRAEAALVVGALALGAGSYLLASALDATPGHIRRWLRVGIGINVTLAAACVALAIWLLLR